MIQHPKVLMMNRLRGKLVSFFVKNWLERKYFSKPQVKYLEVGKLQDIMVTSFTQHWVRKLTF